MEDQKKWILGETKNTKLGDKRLEKRLLKVMESLSKESSNSIPMACRSWTETIAAYRFLNHEKVKSEKILSSHRESTIERIKKEKIVLIAQDTTDIDFSKRKSINGMGHLGTEKSQGLYLHSSIAITPNKLSLGVIGSQTWSRKELGIRLARRNRSIEEKESYRWMKGYNAANEVAKCCSDTLIISIADREGDIYEILEKQPSELNKAFWLIRSSINRRIKKNRNSEIAKLHDFVKATDPVGKISFELPNGKIFKNKLTQPRNPRKKRTVTQQIKISNVMLHPPSRKNQKLSPTVVNIISCEEINPPNTEEKIEWFLITSFPVKNLNTAKAVINWYLCRWQIETFFKILKSGCTIEKLQFKNITAVTNCISLYLIIAWRILYLTMISRIHPLIKCDRIFEDDEWQSLYCVLKKTPPPEDPPELKEIVLMIAQLGGFLNRKSDQHPGSKALWLGLQRMKDFTIAWKTFGSVFRKTYV